MTLTFLQNAIFWPLLFATTAVYTPIATLLVTVLTTVLPHRSIMRVIRHAIRWYGWIIIRCAWPFVRVQYIDLEPEDVDGPFIFVCNHRSASDAMLVVCLPFEVVMIVKAWPFRLPFYGLFARIAGYLSVHEMSLEKFYAKVGRFLNEGISVISFPEGTRSGSREMGAFTSSIFRIALREKASITPLAISGNKDIPPKGSFVLHSGVIRVHKLPTIAYEDYRHMSAFQLKNHVREQLRQHLASIEDDDKK